MRSRIPFSDQRDSSVVCLWFYLVFWRPCRGPLMRMGQRLLGFIGGAMAAVAEGPDALCSNRVGSMRLRGANNGIIIS